MTELNWRRHKKQVKGVRDIEWATLNNLYGSFHFPIICTLFKYSQTLPIQKGTSYILGKANWPFFETITHNLTINIPPFNNVNKEAAIIRKIIIGEANIVIPINDSKFKSKSSWWNSNFEELERITLRDKIPCLPHED